MSVQRILVVTAIAGVIAQAGVVAANPPVQWLIGAGGNDHWYDVVHVPSGITWADANAAAEASGWHLVTITSAEENAFVFDLVDDDPNFWVINGGNATHHGPHMGGFQPPGASEPGGGWTWVTGEPWSYTNWADDQPNDDGGIQDVLLFLGPPSGPGPQWNDAWPGQGMHGYIIEIIPEPATLVLVGAAVPMLLRRKSRRS